MAAPVLWGSEISVDVKSTEGVQSEASVIAFANGSFLAVWADYKAGGDIVGQFFAADGTHKGEAFLVTSSPAGDQGAPQATLLNDGRYVVAWSTSSGAENPGVWARIVDQKGQGGDDLYVGQTGSTGAVSLSVSSLADGFVVSYAYSASFFSSPNTYAYSFGANGTPRAPEVRVNGVLGKSGYESDIVALNSGNYAVFFEGHGYAGDVDGDIRCRVFSATGVELVPEFRVSAPAAGPQSSPSAARLSDGRIAVIWQHGDEATGDRSGYSLRGRIINLDNPQAGPEFQVNLTTIGDQGNPQVTALADGGFAVTYTHMPDPINGGDEDIRIACFNADGTVRGEIRVTADSRVLEPTVTALADGRLLVGWTKWTIDDPNNPKSDIRAQIVDPRNRGVDLAGTSGDDHYIGSAFADRLSGGSGNDHLIGEGGNDTLMGGIGADTLDGGAGHDTYVVGGSDQIIELAHGGHDIVLTDTSYTLGAHLEDLTATGSAAIRLTGNEQDNVLTGNASANTLEGQSGNDRLDGGAGADALDGGTGNDTYYVDDAGDRVVEHAGQGIDTVYVNTAAYVLSAAAEVETLVAGVGALNLTGSDFANAISGNALNNSLWGQAGHDRITAGSGNDKVYGGADNDQLWGEDGNDQLWGDAGHDRISGGLGNDRLWGGTGKDVFVFDTRTNKRTNVDKIYNFKSRDDSFHLDNAIFTKLGRAGSEARPKKFNSDMFVEGTRAQDREDRIVYDKKTGSLYYDQDGTGSKAQVKIATLTNKTKLYWHDFFVI